MTSEHLKLLSNKIFFISLLCFSFRGFSAPAVPASLSASSENYWGATLNWSSVSEADYYKIKYKESWSTDWKFINGITTNSYNIEKCQPNTTYDWHVQAFTGTDSSGYSTNSSFTTTKAIWKECSIYKIAPYNFPGTSKETREKLWKIANAPLSPEVETQIAQRMTNELDTIVKKYSNFGSIYFENEKASYPYAMSTLTNAIALNDNTNITKAVNYLIQNDLYAGAGRTYNVDLFPSFTIKGQVPKYFFFSRYHNQLPKSYEQKMQRAIRYWSTDSLAFTRTYDNYTHVPTYKPVDPYRRKHPDYTNNGSWEPAGKDSWVDIRSTDNLKAMRETTCYLFCNDIGNDTIADIYKQRIIDYVATLYHVGFSEWDSDPYYSHDVAPYLNLYAFAADTSMRKVAKAALDWYIAAGALKYFHGTMAGPFKRVYNGDYNLPLLGTAAKVPYLYFGNVPEPGYSTFIERDIYISLLSGYRPPIAMKGLATQDFDPYTEQLNTHPAYATFQPLTATAPAYFETMYFGKTYRLASAVSSFSDSDMCPFGLEIKDSTHGCLPFFIGPSGSGKHMYGVYTAKNSKDQIAQYRNLMIRLSSVATPYYIALLLNAPMETESGVYFFKYEKTWIAMHLINMKNPVIENITDAACKYKDYIGILKPQVDNTSAPYTGLAIEVCDDSQLSYSQFKEKVLQNPLDISQLASAGEVILTGTDDRFLKMKYNSSNDLPGIYRNSSIAYDWSDVSHYHPYHSITPPQISIDSASASENDIRVSVSFNPGLIGPVIQDWKSGTMKVVSNTGVFTSSLSPGGDYSFSEETLTDQNGRSPLVYFALYENNIPVYETTDTSVLKTRKYSFTHFSATPGIYNYKAVAVDQEGDTAWSNLTSLNFQVVEIPQPTLTSGSFTIFPNPANEFISFYMDKKTEHQVVEIYSTDGKIILSHIIEQAEANEIIKMQVSSLPEGNYMLSVGEIKKVFQIVRK